MTTTVEAIYEQGVLRPKEPLSLKEGAEVKIVIIAPREPVTGASTPAKILAEISALPLEGDGEAFAARDHDQVLYGGKGTP